MKIYSYIVFVMLRYFCHVVILCRNNKSCIYISLYIYVQLGLFVLETCDFCKLVLQRRRVELEQERRDRIQNALPQIYQCMIFLIIKRAFHAIFNDIGIANTNTTSLVHQFISSLVLTQISFYFLSLHLLIRLHLVISTLHTSQSFGLSFG